MSVSPPLSSKLNVALGHDAASDLVTWLDELRREHAEQREAMRADFAEFRHELRALELRLVAEFSGQLNGQIAALGKDLRAELHAVDNKIEKRFSDLLLWSFAFWVGAVGAIAMLARVLRP